MKGIVTLKAWKRPYYLKQILDGILAAHGNENYDYYISIDFHQETNKQSYDLIQEFIKNSKSNSVKFTIHSQQQGCAGNHKVCQEYAFNHENNYDYMIHFEDDTLPGKDLFLWYEWARENYGNIENIFAITPFIPQRQRTSNHSNSDETVSFLEDSFPCQGGFLMVRRIHDMIYKYDGVFGIHGHVDQKNVTPQTFKNGLQIHLSGSWALPFGNYFRNIEGHKYCVTPEVSRANNIGATEGTFNPSVSWHIANILNQNWIESDRYNILNKKEIEYKRLDIC